MKKLLLSGAFIALLGTFSTNAWMHNTPCGIAVQTVSPDFFKTKAEADAFYAELDAKYCEGVGNTGGNGEVTPPSKEEQPKDPIPAVP
ncbi:hypothetical protein [Parabacteroides goldsteinii]|uniref:hypothetical protein n=1 Tax=Parabacteroides goldsteinii TaxID=328812 RepID=UPI00256F0973|nr:hypothetical protein [Parabacteroides goldsteinii]